jgi:hypothetical protein
VSTAGPTGPNGRGSTRSIGPTGSNIGYALRPTNPNALSQASTEELLLELRRRIIIPREAREVWDDWDGGLDPDGDWPAHG